LLTKELLPDIERLESQPSEWTALLIELVKLASDQKGLDDSPERISSGSGASKSSAMTSFPFALPGMRCAVCLSISTSRATGLPALAIDYNCIIGVM